MANLKMNIINSKETRDEWEAKAAAINVACRSLDAKLNNKAFNSADHVARIDAVKNIARSFFTVRENIYINHRSNNAHGRPFTAVKVHRTQWPLVGPKVADARFYKPLEDVGNVELLRSRDGSSHIIRVYL
jgi:hypothetical protein